MNTKGLGVAESAAGVSRCPFPGAMAQQWGKWHITERLPQGFGVDQSPQRPLLEVGGVGLELPTCLEGARCSNSLGVMGGVAFLCSVPRGAVEGPLGNTTS